MFNSNKIEFSNFCWKSKIGRVLLTNNCSLVTLGVISLRPALSSAVNPSMIFLSVFHIWDWKNCKGGWVTISPSRIGRYGWNDSMNLSPCDSITFALVFSSSRADAFLKFENKKWYEMFRFSGQSDDRISKIKFYQKNRFAFRLAENGSTGCRFNAWIKWKYGNALSLYLVSQRIAEILRGEAFNKHHKLHLEKKKKKKKKERNSFNCLVAFLKFYRVKPTLTEKALP